MITSESSPFLTIDPQAKLNISWDWTDWLSATVTISGTPTVAITPAGPTLGTPTKVGNVVTVRVSNCTLGVKYRLTCHVVLSNLEEDDRTWNLWCQSR